MSPTRWSSSFCGANLERPGRQRDVLSTSASRRRTHLEQPVMRTSIPVGWILATATEARRSAGMSLTMGQTEPWTLVVTRRVLSFTSREEIDQSALDVVGNGMVSHDTSRDSQSPYRNVTYQRNIRDMRRGRLLGRASLPRARCQLW